MARHCRARCSSVLPARAAPYSIKHIYIYKLARKGASLQRCGGCEDSLVSEKARPLNNSISIFALGDRENSLTNCRDGGHAGGRVAGGRARGWGGCIHRRRCDPVRTPVPHVRRVRICRLRHHAVLDHQVLAQLAKACARQEKSSQVKQSQAKSSQASSWKRATRRHRRALSSQPTTPPGGACSAEGERGTSGVAEQCGLRMMRRSVEWGWEKAASRSEYGQLTFPHSLNHARTHARTHACASLLTHSRARSFSECVRPASEGSRRFRDQRNPRPCLSRSTKATPS